MSACPILTYHSQLIFGDDYALNSHVALAEAAACHAQTLERQADQYTPNVRLRLEMGRYIMGEDYVRALRGRDVLTRDVNAALLEAGLVANAVTPTALRLAPSLLISDDEIDEATTIIEKVLQ